MRFIFVLILLAQPLAAQTFPVVHEKTLWRDGRGRIEITDEAIVYTAEKEKDSRRWKYEDIQYFDRIGTKEFVILSYEDRKLLLGRDRQFHFRITEGELTDELFRRISSRLNRPVTNRVVPAIGEARYEVAVKHLHTFGGCEGRLQFTDDAIYYVTEHEEDAREWLLARDVQTVWSADRYRLEIVAYDNNRRELSRTRGYRFDLKAPLDPEFYRKLKLRLYDLETTHLP